MAKHRILFVCLGNICRSPLAEAAFRKAAAQADLDVEVDSAGTADYHVGEPPDPRSIEEAHRRGIDITAYRGRQLSVRDFHECDFILGMDRSNMANIARIDPGDGKARVAMLLDLVAGQEGREVADPWYGGPEGFAATWHEVDAGARALLAVLLDETA
ncbi:MAG: low molecular weight protein-tyrosine-phosphatase [Erythrobacter sp.]